MAIAIAFPGFNDLRRTVTPVFLLMTYFLDRFSALREKNEENLSLEVGIFFKMQGRIPFYLAHSSVRQFQMPFEGLSFVKTLVTFEIIYAKDPPIQNMTTIVCLR